ncbi:type II toxin-antitoxin system HipA family toxin [Limnohabitans sp. Rim8]|uniref:type II toxin-antitoxin system HipA family toxin n=1 Tax=Limnohabitans sp. Rim8 TaxID=1100718 RepID=UPI0025E6110F|nr:type II toxin-antitoxin system HipA family toxin [Limnohabitans sp. Rim8]
MGRHSHSRALNIWMNGELLGQWTVKRNGVHELVYADSWSSSASSRPLSLSLPMTGQSLQGRAVENYFDNLLPDSVDIRRRVQTQFRTPSNSAFDLLSAIGRDCVGAVQLMPQDAQPTGWNTIEAQALSPTEVERWLSRVAAPAHRMGESDEESFRISLGGAQEKTALLWHQGQWCRPHGATPTTHILKLPIGLVGNRQADMSTSVENEWLCAQLAKAFGLPVANCEIVQWGAQKTLVVERFDRRLEPSGQYWLRLPQEDFCQALGLPSHLKYEADGGPGLRQLSALLRTSANATDDLRTLFEAQFFFWMLGATDGHAKNFSLSMLAGGSYRLTPLYDILSAWPIVGTGAQEVPSARLKMAMALRGKSPHYLVKSIQPRHFLETAQREGYADMAGSMHRMGTQVSGALQEVAQRLPGDFPQALFDKVAEGMLDMARRMAAGG